MQNVVARFGPVDLERLEQLARALGVTRSECLRKLVREVRVIPAQLIFDGELEAGMPVGVEEAVAM